MFNVNKQLSIHLHLNFNKQKTWCPLNSIESKIHLFII